MSYNLTPKLLEGFINETSLNFMCKSLLGGFLLETVHVLLFLKNRGELLNEFMDSAKVCNSPAQAIEVVKLANAFSLPVCENLIQRAMTDFAMDPEQK